MFEHMLVPLDGSRLAEAALPPAAYLARHLGASVTLVHVIERDAPQTIHGERHLAEQEEAYTYLDGVARNESLVELRVERHVHTSRTGDVAGGIVEHITELKPDLIVMCTHGRGGVRDWVFGSIAQRVVGLGTIPVLLIHPKGVGQEPPFNCRRLLAPVDGVDGHEPGLQVAVELAGACAAELYLLLVVPTLSTLSGVHAATGRFLPGVTMELLELRQQEAVPHLGRYMNQIQDLGLSARAEIGRGEAAVTIIETAQKTGADLVVMGTHGRAGMDALWSGSVAPKVSSRLHLPLLLVPISKIELKQEGSYE